MNKEEQGALEEAGFRVGTVAEFLGLTEEESRLVELRASLSRAIRRLRSARRMTQKQVAEKLKTSQPRVNRIEAGAPDVSLDLMFRELFALGGRLADMVDPAGPAGPKPSSRRRTSKAVSA